MMINPNIVVDTNILIYSALKENKFIRDYLRERRCVVSIISYIETLSFPAINDLEIRYFDSLFKQLHIYPFSDEIITQTIKIRRQYQLKIPDSIIASTALTLDLPLFTNDLKGFPKVPELKIINLSSEKT